jgi:hypothetical protein
MSSSAPLDYSITLNDSISNDTITLSSGTGSSYYYNTGVGVGGFGAVLGTISVGSVSNSTYTIGSGTINSIDTSQFTINLPEEWVNCLPDFDRIEKMCNEYPGLAIAFEKFKTTYKLVKDDYDTPKDKRLKP